MWAIPHMIFRATKEHILDVDFYGLNVLFLSFSFFFSVFFATYVFFAMNSSISHQMQN